jgi:hypothetical protein
MVVATFGPSTAWAGRAITCENGQFMLQDHGPLTAHQVVEYDDAGQLEWAYDGLRAWVHAQAAQAPLAPAARTRRSVPIWAWIVGGIVVVAAVIAIAAAQADRTPADTAADAPAGGGQPAQGITASPPRPTGMVAIYSWVGGGAVSNGLTTSAPIKLQGGHQVFAYTAVPVAGANSPPYVSWQILPGAGSVSPSTVAGGSADLYLEAGTYYISANSNNVNWTVRLSEER